MAYEANAKYKAAGNDKSKQLEVRKELRGKEGDKKIRSLYDAYRKIKDQARWKFYASKDSGFKKIYDKWVMAKK